jgi:CTP synthase (UTP-ammonia lyase)
LNLKQGTIVPEILPFERKGRFGGTDMKDIIAHIVEGIREASERMSQKR